LQLKAMIMGKAGKMVQMANASVLEGMPMDQAANAVALNAFAKGQYGKALMALLAPHIAAKINASGNAGRAASGGSGEL
jgi:hypothetical protein